MNLNTSIAAALGASLGLAAFASADVLITDGFGDGDRDNDSVLEGALEDAGDVGIPWYSIGGATSGGDPKPEPSVAADAGIGSGNAQFITARGGNAELAGFFGQTVTLGTSIGDRMTLSFDVRLDPTNEPLSELTAGAEFRFGLYTDSDNEIGTGGWGTSDGDYDSGNPGVGGDSGFFFRTPIGETEPVGAKSRMIYEGNNADNILGGSGTETIKDEESFGGMYDALKHTISVEFERIAGAPGEDLLITLTIDGSSLTDTTVGEGLPALTSLASFDYFVAMTTEDQDWVIDNFSLSTTNVPAPGAAMLLGITGLAAGARRRR